MKLIVFAPYYPPHIGGLENYADEFNKYLSQKGVDIFVFTPRLPNNTPEKETRYNNVRVIRFPAFEIIPGYPLPRFWNFRFWKLFFSLFKENFDIVMSHTRFFNTSLLALVYCKIKKTRWLHIEHGSDFVKLNNGLFSLIAKFYDYTFGKLTLKLADKVVTVSNAATDFSHTLFKNREYTTIYRGFEVKKIEEIPSAVQLKEKYPNSVIITFIGRLIDGKGVVDLIESFAEIKNNNIKLFIVGDGPQKKHLEKTAKEKNLEKTVVFFGNKPYEETIGILKISDIFVNPSYTEGLPTSVIEAALCRKAVIATNVGGTAEIITDGRSGFLIEPKNPRFLRDKINQLVENQELRRKFSENIYEEVKNKFNWQISILKFQKILENILKYGNKKIYFLSSRHGGPCKQHKIIARELRKMGLKAEHRCDFGGWLKAHFIYGKNRYIITNVPLLMRFCRRGFIFNIKGNYKKERNLFKNPLGYFYGINKLWSEKIVLPSSYLKEILNIPKAIIIPNAVSENLIAESKNFSEKSESDAARLITVTMFGFWEKARGALKIIEALAGVKTNKKVILDIFGKGSFEEEIKKSAVKIILPENIKVNFKGYTKNINEEYKKADIFVYWSDLDITPNVFLEAMAFGLPIIANDFPSFREILGKGNILASNIGEFAKNLEKLIGDGIIRKKMSELNLEEAKKCAPNCLINLWAKLLN